MVEFEINGFGIGNLKFELVNAFINASYLLSPKHATSITLIWLSLHKNCILNGAVMDNADAIFFTYFFNYFGCFSIYILCR